MTDHRHFPHAEIERTIKSFLDVAKASYNDIGDMPKLRAFNEIAPPFFRWFTDEFNRGNNLTPEKILEAWIEVTAWELAQLTEMLRHDPKLRAMLTRDVLHNIMVGTMRRANSTPSLILDGDKGGRA